MAELQPTSGVPSPFDRTLLAQRHTGLGEGIRDLLGAMFEHVLMVGGERSLLACAARQRPTVVVAELSLGPGMPRGGFRSSAPSVRTSSSSCSAPTPSRPPGSWPRRRERSWSWISRSAPNSYPRSITCSPPRRRPRQPPQPAMRQASSNLNQSQPVSVSPSGPARPLCPTPPRSEDDSHDGTRRPADSRPPGERPRANPHRSRRRGTAPGLPRQPVLRPRAVSRCGQCPRPLPGPGLHRPGPGAAAGVAHSAGLQGVPRPDRRLPLGRVPARPPGPRSRSATPRGTRAFSSSG